MIRHGAVRTVTPTTALPVSVADAKAFCRIESDDDDDLISAFIVTAREWLQPPVGWLGRSILQQTLRRDLPCWPARVLTLPAGPVTAVNAITYFDTANAAQTVDPAQYFLDGDELVLADTFQVASLYDRPGAVRITYVAGYADADSIPPPITNAIKQLVAHWYENREAVAVIGALSVVPTGWQDLLSPYRLV